MILSNKYLQFYKYMAASFIALSFDYCIYLLALNTTLLTVPNAAALGYSAGLLFSYIFIKYRVFKHGWLSEKPRTEFSLFLISGMLGLFTTYIVTTYILILFGQRPQLAKLVAVIFSFFAVYFFRKVVVFRPSNISEENA